MKKIKAKFNGKCADTGAVIAKGDYCMYDPYTRNIHGMETYEGQLMSELNEIKGRLARTSGGRTYAQLKNREDSLTLKLSQLNR
jgi:hypothetical protein